MSFFYYIFFKLIGFLFQRLSDKRSTSSRTDKIEEMSGEELLDEKVAVQKALLYFESIYGRPSSKDDRDLVRPLYDRYRSLKRMVARSGMVRIHFHIYVILCQHF